MVARLQSVISKEIKAQLQEKEGRDYPDYLLACIGGGSNAAGTMYHYLDDPRVHIVLGEGGGHGMYSGETAATIKSVPRASCTEVVPSSSRLPRARCKSLTPSRQGSIILASAR